MVVLVWGDAKRNNCSLTTTNTYIKPYDRQLVFHIKDGKHLIRVPRHFITKAKAKKKKNTKKL